jgi:hypothetical protein
MRWLCLSLVVVSAIELMVAQMASRWSASPARNVRQIAPWLCWPTRLCLLRKDAKSTRVKSPAPGRGELRQKYGDTAIRVWLFRGGSGAGSMLRPIAIETGALRDAPEA